MKRRKTVIWSIAAAFLIAGVAGAYVGLPRLMVRLRCIDWPDQTLPGLAANGEYIYVAMGACNTVVAIDTQSHAVVRAARVNGSFPHGIAASADGRQLYVANERSDDVTVFSLPELSSLDSIPVGDFPTDVVPSVDDRHMFVANFKGGSVDIVTRGDRSVRPGPAGARATHFAVSPDGKRIYVTHWDENRLSILDGGDGTLIKTIELAGKPNHATVSRDNRKVYVTLYGDSALAVVDSDRLELIASIPVGLHPMAPAVSPDDRWIYVSNIDGGTLSIIDAGRLAVVGEIVTRGNPQHLVMDQAGRFLWVSNPSRESVQLVDLSSRKVIREIHTGPQPQQMAPRYLNPKPGSGSASRAVGVDPNVDSSLGPL